MSLYRLDYHEGHTVEPVKDQLGRNWLGCTREAADMRAAERAAERGVPVVITRISRYGALRPMMRVFPDGTRKRIPR